MPTTPDGPNVGPVSKRKGAALHGLITMKTEEGHDIIGRDGKPRMYAACPAGVRGWTPAEYVTGEPGTPRSLEKHSKVYRDGIKPIDDKCVRRVCRNPQCQRILGPQFSLILRAYRAAAGYVKTIDEELTDLAGYVETRAERRRRAALIADLQQSPFALAMRIDDGVKALA